MLGLPHLNPWPCVYRHEEVRPSAFVKRLEVLKVLFLATFSPVSIVFEVILSLLFLGF